MKEDVARREVLLGLIAVGAAACLKGGDSESDPDDTSDTSDDTGSASEWASGTTALIAASYDVTFDETCAQTCELTLGPCYAETLDRKDISEGVAGLPARLAFLVVDTDCNPVEGAVVDIWHTSPSGLYSGEDAAQMCTTGDDEAEAGRWFRGTQTTDADGRVDFDSCFPGWYSGRAIHIHLQIRVGNTAYVTSQVGFPEDLIQDVFDNHPQYSGYGQPDTSNAADNILGDDTETWLMSWRRADDGVLVATKTITIRSSLSDGTC